MGNTIEKNINKDLILRERLAVQRTYMANQTTLLSFIRTSLYFFVAGLSIRSFFKVEILFILEPIFFIFSLLIAAIGLIQFLKQKKAIKASERHIGNYQDEYQNERS
jgi:putative membrane protein